MSDDDWKYKRTRQQHFTADEIALIRVLFNQGWKPKAVARKLECSSRVIQTHFTNLRSEIPVRDRSKAPKAKPFYKSNFEL